MSIKRILTFFLLLCCLTCSFAACNVPTVTIKNPVTTTPTVNQQEINIWYKAAPGVELRYEDWKSPGNDEDIVTIVRFDLHRINLHVAYQPTHPLLMSQWMQKEHVTAMINGGYFDQQNRATGLIIANGQVSGSSYKSFGGMLSEDAQGNISLRSLHQQPYDPNNEQLQEATQSTPMLVIGGKRTQFQADAGGRRRSIVAEDRQGHLLLIVCPDMAFSLDEVADLLLASDLSIVTALNLDGGSSTGLYVNAGSQHVAIDSGTQLPIVVMVQAR